MDLYRLNFDAGGMQESENLQELQALRQVASGTILAIKKVFYVSGDSSGQGYETYTEADNVCNQLRQDNYGVEPLEIVVDPQPEGLNN